MTATITATRLTTEDLARQLPDILQRVRQHGERFLVVEANGHELAFLGPAPVRGITGRDLAKRLEGLDWPDDEFANDLEKAQMAQTLADPSSWES